MSWIIHSESCKLSYLGTQIIVQKHLPHPLQYIYVISVQHSISTSSRFLLPQVLNTLRTGDTDLRFYITTVQDGWRKSAFLIRACFPCTVHLIMQYIEPVSEWSCWRMFIETWPHSELTFKHRASSIYRRFATLQRTVFIYLINKYISLSDSCLTVHHWYK